MTENQVESDDLTDAQREALCICGQGPEPAEWHDYDCPVWDGTVQPSPCDSHYEDGPYLVVTLPAATDGGDAE